MSELFLAFQDNQTTERLSRLEDTFKKKSMQAALRFAAVPLRKALKARAPVRSDPDDKREPPGALQKSLGVATPSKSRRRDLKIPDGVAAVFAGSVRKVVALGPPFRKGRLGKRKVGTFQKRWLIRRAIYLEFGTSKSGRQHISPNKFQQDSLRAVESEFQRRYLDKLREQINKITNS